jgi:hypothetical protein
MGRGEEEEWIDSERSRRRRGGRRAEYAERKRGRG